MPRKSPGPQLSICIDIKNSSLRSRLGRNPVPATRLRYDTKPGGFMLTRRDLGRRFGLVAAGLAMGGEAAYAQRRTGGRDLSRLVLLNANENPDGPPQFSIDAMTQVLARSRRYHDEDTEQLGAAIAAGEQLQPDQVLVGCGSSEI